MTLPAGQISLSEVNVELGYSATALITMNDTAVRNLAGVPSGQISMSNLQGKSANSYFILYGGMYNTVGSFKGSIVASNQGTVVISTVRVVGSSEQTVYIGNDGVVTGTRYYSTATGRACLVSADTTNPRWYFKTPSVYFNCVDNSTPSTWNFSSAVAFSTDMAGNYRAQAINSNNVFMGIAGTNFGKSIAPRIQIYSSTGTYVDGKIWTGQEPAGYDRYRMFARTDNTFVMIGARTNYAYSYLFNPTSAAVVNSVWYVNGFGTFDMTNGDIDSSNNIYMCADNSSSSVYIARYNSSRQPTHLRFWNISTGSLNGTDMTGAVGNSLCVYGNYVYLAHSAATPAGQGYWLVICLNAADLTFVWGKSITSTGWGFGSSTSSAGSLSSGRDGTSIYANQYGVWTGFIAGNSLSNTKAATYLAKLPLNGSVTNGSYSVGGLSLVIADYTPTLTTQTLPTSTTPALPSVTNGGSATTTNSTITTGTNPTLTKTALS